MEPTTHDIAMNILAQLKQRMGEARYAGLSPEDRRLLRACCADAAELQVRALAAPRTPEAQVALIRERAQINAQLLNLSAVAAGEVVDAFWDAVRFVVNGAVAVAFAAL